MSIGGWESLNPPTPKSIGILYSEEEAINAKAGLSYCN